MDDDFDPLLETGRAVAKSLDGQPIKCPHCSEEFRIRPVAAFAAQDLIFNIKYEGDSISAQTIGGVILNTDKLLRSIANDMGVKALVFLKRVEQGDKEMSALRITVLKEASCD